MATFVAASDLNEKVAAMVAPEVGKVAKRVARLAKQYAPANKRWISMDDGRVRETHIAAHGQEVPENLRYDIQSRQWDIHNLGALGIDWLNEPNDPTAGLPGDAAQFLRGRIPFGCRCKSVKVPGVIAKQIRTGGTIVEGSTARAVVSCEGEWVVQAERGDYYPIRGGVVHNEGTHFMARAARDVAAGVTA
jgi:hypothetical protein